MPPPKLKSVLKVISVRGKESFGKVSNVHYLIPNLELSFKLTKYNLIYKKYIAVPAQVDGGAAYKGYRAVI